MRLKRTGVLLLAAALLLSWITDVEARRRRRRRISGTLVIDSSTKGAKVFIDGDEVGSIPLGRPIRLMPGQHTVKVTKPGHTQFMEGVTIRRGGRVRLEVELLAINGVMTLETSPLGARVYLDGKFVGKTPIRDQEVKAGAHTVRLAHIGFYDAIRKFSLQAGKPFRLIVQLLALPDNINPLIPKVPPKKWYERWWVWASAAGGLIALVTAIAAPLAVTRKDPVKDFNADRLFNVP